MFIEVLTEGTSDVPVLREVLVRHFGLNEHVDFRIHAHQGRGNMPANPLAQPDPKHRGLFDQLPAKLRGFGKYMDDQCLVLVLVDVDNDDDEGCETEEEKDDDDTEDEVDDVNDDDVSESGRNKSANEPCSLFARLRLVGP